MDDTDERSTSGAGPVVAALGGDANAIEVLRFASSLAKGLGTGVDCLTVDTGAYSSANEGRFLEEAQRAAARSGARVISRANADAAAGILDYAGERGAQAVVLGMGRHRRALGQKGVFARVLYASGALAVLAVGATARSDRRSDDNSRPDRSKLPAIGYKVLHYVIAFAVIAVLTALNFALTDYAGYWAAAITYLAAISLMALVLDRLPILFAGLLSAAAWDFCFIPPRYTFTIGRTEDVLMLFLYLFVAVCSGWLTGRLSANERLLVARERRMSRLSTLASALAGAVDLNAIVTASVGAFKEAFDAEATIILRAGAGELRAEAETGWEPLDENARVAARLCLDSGNGTGRYTDDFEASEWHFVPMESPRGRLGVIGLRSAHDQYWNQDIESYLRTMARTVSIAVARVFPDQS